MTRELALEKAAEAIQRAEADHDPARKFEDLAIADRWIALAALVITH